MPHMARFKEDKKILLHKYLRPKKKAIIHKYSEDYLTKMSIKISYLPEDIHGF
jgi:hypothetical protein